MTVKIILGPKVNEAGLVLHFPLITCSRDLNSSFEHDKEVYGVIGDNTAACNAGYLEVMKALPIVTCVKTRFLADYFSAAMCDVSPMEYIFS
jgi:hypothetical protein